MKKLLIALMSFSAISMACMGEEIHVPENKEYIASWYGNPFHGRITASGYVYDMEQLTCASMDYPFGSVLRVTNLENGKWVDVVVTDTGSFKKKYGRDIDLSKKAFSKLDKLGKGILKVDIKLIDDSKTFKYKQNSPLFKEEDYE